MNVPVDVNFDTLNPGDAFIYTASSDSTPYWIKTDAAGTAANLNSGHLNAGFAGHIVTPTPGATVVL